MCGCRSGEGGGVNVSVCIYAWKCVYVHMILSACGYVHIARFASIWQPAPHVAKANVRFASTSIMIDVE